MIDELPYRKRYEPMDNKISPELWEALNKLTLKEKDTVLMYWFKNGYYHFKIKNIAKHLGITERAVNYRLKRANEKLRGLLK